VLINLPILSGDARSAAIYAQENYPLTCAPSVKRKKNVLNSSSEMDVIDRTILNIIQEEFPLTEKPFEAIGKQAGISGEETLERIRRLTEKGYIRRIGLVLERKKLGYVSLLCGTNANTDTIEAIAEEINKEPGVTHNYEREGELNLWFTITMKTMDDIDTFITTLEKTFPIKVYRFPEKRTFKIKTYFPV
jgi:DNA-binding Lrp family transcriptional regulator